MRISYWSSDVCSSDLAGARGEIFVDIGQRAEQPLLFSTPQDEADRAFRPHAHGLEDARRLHHHGAARGVVGRAVGSDPTVDLRACHHIALSGVGAENVGADVAL